MTDENFKQCSGGTEENDRYSSFLKNVDVKELKIVFACYSISKRDFCDWLLPTEIQARDINFCNE